MFYSLSHDKRTRPTVPPEVISLTPRSSMTKAQRNVCHLRSGHLLSMVRIWIKNRMFNLKDSKYTHPQRRPPPRLFDQINIPRSTNFIHKKFRSCSAVCLMHWQDNFVIKICVCLFGDWLTKWFLWIASHRICTVSFFLPISGSVSSSLTNRKYASSMVYKVWIPQLPFLCFFCPF